MATFTGGRKVGNYSYPCRGIIGYATSRTGHVSNLFTNLPNKIDAVFHKPLKFVDMDIVGKYPQHFVVSVGGSTTEVDMVEEPVGSGYGRRRVSLSDLPGYDFNSPLSSISVRSTDPSWSFGIYSMSYADFPRNPNRIDPPPNYCNVESAPRPAPQNLSGYDWTMRSEVSDADGLVLSNIRLKGRLMAERISVPYYKIETSTTPPLTGELRPNDSGGSMRSRLVSYSTETNR